MPPLRAGSTNFGALVGRRSSAWGIRFCATDSCVLGAGCGLAGCLQRSHYCPPSVFEPPFCSTVCGIGSPIGWDGTRDGLRVNRESDIGAQLQFTTLPATSTVHPIHVSPLFGSPPFVAATTGQPAPCTLQLGAAGSPTGLGPGPPDRTPSPPPAHLPPAHLPTCTPSPAHLPPRAPSPPPAPPSGLAAV